MSTISLQKQIENKQQVLLQLVQQYGFTHPLVISPSYELDQLIYLYMKHFSNSSSRI
ncbi:aspartyl-phosphate phosphatase Spo0E family protein [Bacillus cereus]|uniref:aspartyl-phosphate phosphatase Spo0E family protein n=1 Tax=Bacillus cereus TaxID=1396 RepID=UPI000BEE57D0|nr:aspartyl-phosphate phosphatase Spo0E family protein [Bacillus cereus]PEA01790.1 Spo0E family sporulation regulatory protein-aspartic acid phosphatase [Bacillus cereus]